MSKRSGSSKAFNAAATAGDSSKPLNLTPWKKAAQPLRWRRSAFKHVPFTRNRDMKWSGSWTIIQWAIPNISCASGFDRSRRLPAEALISMADDAQLTPQTPQRYRNQKPRRRTQRERTNGQARREQPHAQAKRRKTDTSQTCAGGVERCRIGSSALPGKPELFLALALMFFDQRNACAENGGKGEKQASRFRPEILGDESGHRCCQSAEREAQDIFVPSALFERGPIDANHHRLTQ